MKNTFLTMCAVALMIISAACGNGNSNGNAEENKAVEIKTINVKTTREFLEAIGSNRTIVIEQNMTDLTAELTKMVKEGKVKEKGIVEPIQPEENGCISATAMEEGYSLNIVSVENFTIDWADNANGVCSIQVDPSDANVMGFYHCKNVTLKHLGMEHKKQDGCTGDVVYIFGSNNISLISCSLNGCGVIGVDAVKSKDINVTKTGIFDCSAYGARIKDCENVAFSECSITDIGVKEFDLYDSKNISVSKCEFEKLDSLVSGNMNAADIAFKDCKQFNGGAE